MIMLLNIFDEYRKNLLNNCASAYVIITIEIFKKFFIENNNIKGEKNDNIKLAKNKMNTNNIKHLLMNTAVQKFIELYKYMKNICDYNLKEITVRKHCSVLLNDLSCCAEKIKTIFFQLFLGLCILDITSNSIISIGDAYFNENEQNEGEPALYYNINLNKKKYSYPENNIDLMDEYRNTQKIQILKRVNLNNYNIINQKLYETKIETNHKNLKKAKIYLKRKKRKMKKDRISALYKLYFERKTDSDNENESKAMNSENEGQWKDAKTKNIPKDIKPLDTIEIKAAYLNTNLNEKINAQISIGDKNFN
ncbi:hypothetical protein H8356DRAFT_1402524 [Neocallimastix lanati (nom. inval.)]|nr:hypothetical protein H8356DRAFT_1402524 [Neocallimastix sp. JGI-2020a]